MIKYLLSILSVSILLFNGETNLIKSEPAPTREIQYNINPFLKLDFRQLRDTIFTMKDNFIEVNLSTQQATMYSRDGSIYNFPVSSGNKHIEKGMETREGLYVIQYKSKNQPSVQFDNTMMLNWMGFNGGIGFHALLGNSYYKYLGKKNVSHGCIRISREDAKFIYDKIGKGTPVLVHKGSSMVKIGFGKSGEVYKYYSFSELSKIIPGRYNEIYNSRYFSILNDKLLIDEENVWHSGLPIGNAELIPSIQNLKPSFLWIDKTKSEEEKLAEIISGKEKSDFTLNPFLDSRNNKF